MTEPGHYDLSLFFFAWDTSLLLIALVYPFVAVLRGQRFLKTFLIAWGLLILDAFLICGVLPYALYSYNKPLSYQLGELHFEPPAIVVVIFVGWFYPLIAASIAYTARALWLRQHKRPSQNA